MRFELAIIVISLMPSDVSAQERSLSFPAGVVFETGDTWVSEGRKYRLFGVQSCLRGTLFRPPEGESVDCGLRSIVSTAALFATGSIGCQPIDQTKDDASFVVCAVAIGNDTVDVGTALIASGAAFAAVFASGVPVTSAYAVAELGAQEQKNGLWAGIFEHPAAALLKGTPSK